MAIGPIEPIESFLEESLIGISGRLSQCFRILSDPETLKTVEATAGDPDARLLVYDEIGSRLESITGGKSNAWRLGLEKRLANDDEARCLTRFSRDQASKLLDAFGEASADVGKMMGSSRGVRHTKAIFGVLPEGGLAGEALIAAKQKELEFVDDFVRRLLQGAGKVQSLATDRPAIELAGVAIEDGAIMVVNFWKRDVRVALGLAALALVTFGGFKLYSSQASS